MKTMLQLQHPIARAGAVALVMLPWGGTAQGQDAHHPLRLITAVLDTTPVQRVEVSATDIERADVANPSSPVRVPSTFTADTLWQCNGIYTAPIRTMGTDPFWRGWFEERTDHLARDAAITLPDSAVQMDTTSRAQFEQVLELLRNLKPRTYTYHELLQQP